MPCQVSTQRIFEFRSLNLPFKKKIAPHGLLNFGTDQNNYETMTLKDMRHTSGIKAEAKFCANCANFIQIGAAHLVNKIYG